MGDPADQISLRVSSMIGSIVSVHLRDGGYYQGRLVDISPTNKTIKLVNPFKDGRPVHKDVELCHTLITTVKVIRNASGEAAPQTVAEPVTPPKEVQERLMADSWKNTCLAPPPASSLPPPTTPQAVVKPTTQPIELSALEAALFLKPALKPTAEKKQQKKSSVGDQSDTPSRTGTKQTRFEETQSTEQVNWVSRPLAAVRRRRRSADLFFSSARSTPTNASDDDETLGIAPTPLFRKYEPQVANPTTLETRTSMRYSNSRQSKRNAGPSGIPELDAARGRVTGKASDLNKPLDMNLLETDFDFEGNLAQFNKETDVDDDFYEAVEKPKMSVNYAHYENIVNDPSRCHSWTNVVSKNAFSEMDYDESEAAEEDVSRAQRRPGSGEKGSKKSTPPRKSPSQQNRRRSLTSKRIVVSQYADCTHDDTLLKLPVLDEKEKARLAKETRSFLGEDAYSLILADRVLEWMFQVIASQAILVERVALLAADSTAQSMLDRILMQLSARGCRVSLYGVHLEKALPLVELVASERDLPSDVQLIVDLDPSMQRKSRSAELTRWIDDLGNAHVICLDHVLPGVTDNGRVHALMVGAISTSVMDTMRKASMVVPKIGPTSVAELFGTMAVPSATQGRPHVGLADLGVPFAWFGDEAANALSHLFATTFVAHCNLK